MVEDLRSPEGQGLEENPFYSPKGRFPLKAIPRDLGLTPGTEEYLEAVSWIALSMTETIEVTSDADLDYEIGGDVANLLRDGVLEYQEIIKNAQNIGPEIAILEQNVPGNHPSLENRHKVRKPDPAHPWLAGASYYSRNETPVVPELEQSFPESESEEPEMQSYSWKELVTKAGLTPSLRTHMQLRNIFRNHGLQFSQTTHEVPSYMLDVVLNELNPKRNASKEKKKK